MVRLIILRLRETIENLLHWSLFYCVLLNVQHWFSVLEKIKQFANARISSNFEPDKRLQSFQNGYFTKLDMQFLNNSFGQVGNLQILNDKL